MTLKKYIALLLMILLAFGSLVGCGSSSSNDQGAGDAEAEDTEEDSEESTSQGAVKARVELDEYTIVIESAEDTVVQGEINKSFGQDIIAMKGSEEVARITLDGNDGESEWFSIVIPADVLTGETNIQIKGGAIAGVVEETNTKTVSINIHD